MTFFVIFGAAVLGFVLGIFTACMMVVARWKPTGWEPTSWEPSCEGAPDREPVSYKVEPRG